MIQSLVFDICRKIPSRKIKHSLYKVQRILLKRNIKKKTIVIRKGVKFELDLSEVTDSAIYHNFYEKGITAIFEKYLEKGDVVFDVGANIGYYTLLSASLIGKEGEVYSFEPVPATFNRLKFNLSLNNFQNIIPENLGVSDKNDKQKVFLPTNYKITGEHKGELQEVNLITIDSYVKENKIKKLDLIKIDTDGFDFSILQGAINTIQRFKPKIIVEVDLNKGSEEFLNFLFSLRGYGVFSDREKRFEKKDDLKKEFERRGVINVLITQNYTNKEMKK